MKTIIHYWLFFAYPRLLQNIILTLCISFAYAEDPTQIHHSYVSESVWEEVGPYLMPKSHPLKRKLNKIFSQSRVLKGMKSLWLAGFTPTAPQKSTGVIVTKHKDMPGYIFKLYADNQTTVFHQPEYTDWIGRASGAEYLRQEIAAAGWEAYFKAPKKWIYALPAEPMGSYPHIQKNFILVEEDMEILSSKENEEKWRSASITPHFLNMLFHLLATTGLVDGSKPANIPFCKDGKIAFVDTQWHHKKPDGFHKLFRILPKNLWPHWQNLIDEQKDAAAAEEALAHLPIEAAF